MKDLFAWQILGHKKIAEYLQKSIVSGRLSHAYLFYGLDNLGKSKVAEEFVLSLQCESNNKKGEKIPCRKCPHCRQIMNSSHPDVYLVKKEENKKNISIEQIRALQRKLYTSTFHHLYKIGLINQAHFLSEEAANSLLKVLEEPTAKTVIILIAQNIEFLPRTIVSRCQLIRFLPVLKKEIYNFLLKEYKLETEKAEDIASLSQGRPGLALNLVNSSEILESYRNDVEEFMKIMRDDLSQRFKYIESLIPFNSSLEKIRGKINLKIKNWLSILRDLILIKEGNLDLVVNRFQGEVLAELSQEYNLEKLIKSIEELNLVQRNLEQNVNPKLALENYFLNL